MPSAEAILLSFVFKGYDDEVYGGERSGLQMLSGLKRWTPVVVVNVDDHFAQALRARGVDVRVLSVVNVFRGFRNARLTEKLARFGAWLEYNTRARDLIQAIRPAAIHCNDLEAYVLVAPAALLARIPVVMHVRCERRMRWFHQLAMVLAGQVVTVSRGIERVHVARTNPLVRKRLERKSTVVHNGISLNDLGHVDENRRQEARCRLGIPADEFAVVVVGSLERRKGQLWFLKGVAPIVASECPSVRFFLVGGMKGDETYANACRLTAASLGERVCFVGYTESIADWYLAADAIALPSEAEGLPRTAIEAGAFGRAIVSTDVPGVSDIIDDGRTGFLVRPGDASRFASRVVELSRDHSLRTSFGRAARTRVESSFAIEHCVSAFETLLESAVLRRTRQ